MSTNILSMATYAAIALSSLSASAESILDFSYNSEGAVPNIFGFEKTESYDIAIRVDDPSLVGCQVVGMSVSFMPSADEADNVSAWMTKDLTLKKIDGKKVNIPDITSQTVTPAEGMIDVTFDAPYTITEAGVYVGYSFNIKMIDSEYALYPVAVVPGDNENGLYLHTSRSRLKWMNYVERIGGVSAMVLKIKGDFSANSAGISLPETIYLPVGKATSVDVSLTNHGSEPVKSIEYTYSAGTVSGTKSLTLDNPIKAIYGTSSKVTLPLDAFSELGNFDMTVTVDKINGEANADRFAEAKSPLEVLPFVPVNRPLVEEYTGTWCGYCPLGYVTLETMKAEYDADFIALAYHDSDPMAVVPDSEWPSYVDGFPMAFVNRGMELSPDEIPMVWSGDRSSFVPVDISVNASWTDDTKTILRATATVTAAKDLTGMDYAIAYALVADGLKGPSDPQDKNYKDWLQSNYFDEDDPLTGVHADLFNTGESKVAGLEFNDVILSLSSAYGEYGSLPSDFTAGVAQSHSYTFDLTGAENAAILELVKQNPDRVRVVAIVMDTYDEVSVNCNSSDYADGSAFSGITNTVTPAGNVIDTEYYDLTGRRIINPSTGIYVKKEIMDNGSHRVSKVANHQ